MPVRGQCKVSVTDHLTVLEGPVMLAYGGTNLRFTAFQEGITGSWSGKTRYRKVKVRAEKPDSSYTTSATARTDTTPFSEDFSLSGLGSFLFVQPPRNPPVQPKDPPPEIPEFEPGLPSRIHSAGVLS